ncbi:MAG: alpha/beta hydrolase [Planctomycetaceae bacterium]
MRGRLRHGGWRQSSCSAPCMSQSAIPVTQPVPTASLLIRRARRLFTTVLVMYLTLLMLIAILQRKLIYHPSNEAITPDVLAKLEGRSRDVQITSRDQLSLTGWLVDATIEREHAAPPAADAANQAELAANDSRSRPLVIYFQGNAGHRGRRVRQIDMLNRLGCDVLIFDYRGYGQNPGSPTEALLAEDAAAVWEFATGDLGRSASEIIIFGESLGGGVATRLAADVCQSGTPPAGLVIRASFSSLVDTAAYHYPWLPVRWVLLDRFPSAQRIAQVTAPILILHGDRDQIIPYEQAEVLYAAAPDQSRNGIAKRLVKLEGAGHNDILYVAYNEVRAALDGFVTQVVSGAPKR